MVGPPKRNRNNDKFAQLRLRHQQEFDRLRKKHEDEYRQHLDHLEAARLAVTLNHTGQSARQPAEDGRRIRSAAYDQLVKDQQQEWFALTAKHSDERREQLIRLGVTVKVGEDQPPAYLDQVAQSAQESLGHHDNHSPLTITGELRGDQQEEWIALATRRANERNALLSSWGTTSPSTGRPAPTGPALQPHPHTSNTSPKGSPSALKQETHVTQNGSSANYGNVNRSTSTTYGIPTSSPALSLAPLPRSKPAKGIPSDAVIVDLITDDDDGDDVPLILRRPFVAKKPVITPKSLSPEEFRSKIGVDFSFKITPNGPVPRTPTDGLPDGSSPGPISPTRPRKLSPKRKTIQPDQYPEVPLSQFRQQQVDRGSILKAPLTPSRKSSLLVTLENQKKNGHFVNHISRNERTKGWSPEIQDTFQRGPCVADWLRDLTHKEKRSGLVTIKSSKAVALWQNLEERKAGEDIRGQPGVSALVRSHIPPAVTPPTTHKLSVEAPKSPGTSTPASGGFKVPSQPQTPTQKRKLVTNLSDSEEEFIPSPRAAIPVGPKPGAKRTSPQKTPSKIFGATSSPKRHVAKKSKQSKYGSNKLSTPENLYSHTETSQPSTPRAPKANRHLSNARDLSMSPSQRAANKRSSTAAMTNYQLPALISSPGAHPPMSNFHETLANFTSSLTSLRGQRSARIRAQEQIKGILQEETRQKKLAEDAHLAELGTLLEETEARAPSELVLQGTGSTRCIAEAPVSHFNEWKNKRLTGDRFVAKTQLEAEMTESSDEGDFTVSWSY